MHPNDELNRRLASLYQRGVVTGTGVRNGLAMMQAEFMGKAVRAVGVPQGYGTASVPEAGSEVFALFANGEADHGMALAFDDRRKRPTDLAKGEVMLYGSEEKGGVPFHSIRFTNKPKPGTIKIRAHRIEIRAGKFYALWDEDEAIGAKSGEFDPDADLPLNPP